MPEYTWLTLLGLTLALILDRALKTRLFERPKFWLFQLVGLVLTLGFDGILENLPIILFDYQHTLGLRIWNIPLENFVFGFNFLAINVIFYEYFRNRFDSSQPLAG
jgi:lycopene cyclase domain-containing protein